MRKHKRNETNFYLQPKQSSTSLVLSDYSWCCTWMTWWRHQMEIFSASLALCAWGKPPVTDGIPPQRRVTRSFDVFFDLCPNKRLRKQSRHWWFETPSRPLWRHRNERAIVYRRSVRMKTYINTHMHIHFCWFNFDALAQENAFKPHKGTDKLSCTRRGWNSCEYQQLNI